ncbi:hypothetical protein [Enterococcus sp. DIV2454a]|uniref:hypothetical protein n=1 Tax=unclassified Enterococcus TaxID=2608891 RepID=UPI003F1E844D
MKQNRKEFSSYFSRSIKQNKPLYLLLMSSETNPYPRPVIGTFRGYAEENKIIIGEDSYSIGVLPTKRAKHTLSKFRHEKSRFLLLGVASGKCGFTTLSCCNRQVEMVTYIIFSPSLRYHHSMLKT